jgi:hypothetical protein
MQMDFERSIDEYNREREEKQATRKIEEKSFFIVDNGQ